MDDAEDEETSISILNHNGACLPDNNGTASMPQYHMYSGAIPKDTTDPSASHHALTLAYRDLKRKYDQVLEKLDHIQRHSPQRRRSKLGSDQTDRRTKSATLPMLPSQTPNGVSELTRSRSPVYNHTELQVVNGGQAEILKEQSEEIDRLKKEVADLRLTIAGREMRERSIGTTDEVVQKLIKQMQVMKKDLQEQTYIIQRLLKRRATTYDSFERKDLSGLHLPSSRMTSVDSRTDNKAIVRIDEEDTCDYAVPNGRAEDDADIYGLPTLHGDPASIRARDDNWDEPATLGATGGDLGTLEATGGDMGATGDAVGNQHRRGPLPPRAPLNIEYNVGTGPIRNRDDNVGLSVNFHTQATTQRQPAAVLNNDPLAGHKPLTSHRNIFHAEAATGDKTAATAQAQAEAAVLIECPVCAQQFDVPQNSPEFQHHVDECLQNGGSPEGAPRRCPVCSEEFAATVDQKDYEMHVNRHFDDEDISDRFQILDFAHPQNN